MKIEVVLLLYNRPEHSEAVLHSLLANGLTDLRVFMDYSDKPEVQENQRIMLDALARFGERMNINLYRQTENFGLARSVRFALNHTFEDADAVLLLEDDCVVRPGGLGFFFDGLRQLRGNRRVRSLSGYLYPCDFIWGGDDELLMLNRFCTWGWATWKERWADYNANLAEVVAEFERRHYPIEECGTDLATLCKSPRYLAGKVDIWSLPWTLVHYLSSTFCVYPRESVVENIGFDGSGANCEVADAFEVKPRDIGSYGGNWSRLHYYLENEDKIRDFLDKHGLKAFPEP